jgi:hypothetical protein
MTIPVVEQPELSTRDQRDRIVVSSALELVMLCRQSALDAIAALSEPNYSPFLALYSIATQTRLSLTRAVQQAGGVDEFGVLAEAVNPAVARRGWAEIRPSLVSLHTTIIPGLVQFADDHAAEFIPSSWSRNGTPRFRTPMANQTTHDDLQGWCVAVRDVFDAQGG